MIRLSMFKALENNYKDIKSTNHINQSWTQIHKNLKFVLDSL
jgi:hypothetical protein